MACNSLREPCNGKKEEENHSPSVKRGGEKRLVNVVDVKRQAEGKEIIESEP